LYNVQIGDAAICFQRTSKTAPSARECGLDIGLINGQIDHLNSANLATWILEQVQDAFDALKLPPVIIVPNKGFFSSLFTSDGGINSSAGGSTAGTDSRTSTTIDGNGGSLSPASALVASIVVLVASVLALM